MMKTILTCLMLSAFAVPVHAGHGSIEETDDGYIVEYSSDSAEKSEESHASDPEVGVPVTNFAGPEGSEMRTENTTPASPRPARTRGQGRMENAPRVARPSTVETE